MKSEKFFKWIWHFNGLILFIVIVVGGVSITYQFVTSLWDRDTKPQPTLNLAKDDKQEEKWRLGYPRKVGNTDFHFIPLESEKLSVQTQKRSDVYESFSGGGYTKTRSKNVLFISGTTNNAVWLFKSTNQLIIDINPLYLRDDNQHSNVRGISYEVINSDSNNDNILDFKDKSTFALSHVDGSNYTELITGYDHIVEASLNSRGNLFVMYVENNDVYSMVIDLDTLSITDKGMLPKVSG